MPSVTGNDDQGLGYGVQGSSANGEGVVGVHGGPAGTGAGVHGSTTSADFGARGVYGEAVATSGQTVGVEGHSLSSPIGTGVVGFGNATGGYFEAQAQSGTGVRAQGGQFAGYFDGDVHVNGNVGIGITNPGAKVSAVMTEGPTSAKRTIEAYSNGGVGVAFFQQDNPDFAGNALQVNGSGHGYAAAFFGVSDRSKGVVISVPPGEAALQVITGTKSAVVATSQGARACYTEESTEVWL
jgi:hypothetical protein